MRLSYGLCPEERAFLGKRKKVVAAALKQALQLDEDLKEDEVWGYSRDVGVEILGWSVLSIPKECNWIVGDVGFLFSLGVLFWAEG